MGKPRKAPDVPAEFTSDPVGDFLAGLGLDEGFTTAEGETVLAFELTQAIFDFHDFDQHAGIIVPSLGVLAAFAVVGAALGPKNGPEAVAVNDIVALQWTAEPDIAVWDVDLFG